MSIYPRKEGGKTVGGFRVEVQRDGRRKTGLAKSMSEAKSLEKALIAQLLGKPKPKVLKTVVAFERPKGATMADGRARANGILWVGQATEVESYRKLDRIISIVGADRELDDFDTSTVDDVVAELTAGGASPATINRYLSCLSAFFKFCKARDLRKKELPTFDWRDEDEGRIRWITDDEEDVLLSLLSEPFRTVVYVAIRTGLRASELLGLKPDQVTSEWLHLWKTKNGSYRAVPINDKLFCLIEPLVSTGSMPQYHQLRHAWDAARKTMGLLDDPAFVFHTCRHSYATRAIQAGMHTVVLQKIMGHKTIQTTLRYAHVDDKTVMDAARSALDFHDRRREPKVA